MADNIQVTLHNKLDELRRELDSKIDKKLPIQLALWIAAILFAAIGGTYLWLMNQNEKITRVETKIEMMQSARTQETLPSIPTKK